MPKLGIIQNHIYGDPEFTWSSESRIEKKLSSLVSLSRRKDHEAQRECIQAGRIITVHFIGKDTKNTYAVA